MRGAPYTPAKLTCYHWESDDIAPTPVEAVGGFLRTRAGSCYRIESAYQLPSGSWKLHVTRWPIDEVPEDAYVSMWSWSKRLPRRLQAGATI